MKRIYVIVFLALAVVLFNFCEKSEGIFGDGWGSQEYWIWQFSIVEVAETLMVATDTIYPLPGEEYAIYFDYANAYLLLNKRILYYSYEPSVENTRPPDYSVYKFSNFPWVYFPYTFPSNMFIYSFPISGSTIRHLYPNSNSIIVKNYFLKTTERPW